MNILFNGKRIVKWLLRLLPFILLFASFIYFTVASNQSYEAIYQLDGYNPLMNFWDSFVAFEDTYGANYFSIFNLTQTIIDFLEDNFNMEQSMLMNLDLIISILVYELFLSFMFLIFDVFNYILSVCSKFLNKGENINE